MLVIAHDLWTKRADQNLNYWGLNTDAVRIREIRLVSSPTKDFIANDKRIERFTLYSHLGVRFRLYGLYRTTRLSLALTVDTHPFSPDLGEPKISVHENVDVSGSP